MCWLQIKVMCCVVLPCVECGEPHKYVIGAAAYMCVEQLAVSWHSFSRALIGSCEG